MYIVWKDKECGYPVCVKYWASDNWNEPATWNRNMRKTTFVQDKTGVWRLFSRNVPVSKIEAFGTDTIIHCVVVLKKEELQYEGRAYIAHVTPEVRTMRMQTAGTRHCRFGRISR